MMDAQTLLERLDAVPEWIARNGRFGDLLRDVATYLATQAEQDRKVLALYTCASCGGMVLSHVPVTLCEACEAAARPTFAEWAEAHGGEEAALLRFCLAQEPQWGYTLLPDGAGHSVAPDRALGWHKRDRVQDALEAACAAAGVPLPWAPEPVEEWLPPETVEGCIMVLHARGFDMEIRHYANERLEHAVVLRLPFDGVCECFGWVSADVLGSLQDACRWVHAREEAADAG